MSFFVRIMQAGMVLAFFAPATDLKITDSRGAEVVVRGAIIDYGGMLTVDNVADGIRVLQGDATVNVKWSDVDTLRVTKVDSTEKPPRINLEIVLRNKKRVAAALYREGHMKLTGKSDLGDYSIDLEKVQRIVPIR